MQLFLEDFKMSLKTSLSESALNKLADTLLNYLNKDPEKNILKVLDKVKIVFTSGMFPKENYMKMREAAKNPNNTYVKLIKNILRDVDQNIIRQLVIALGYHAAYLGTKTVRANREKYNCNIPWVILLDPTSACNLNCKGCWSAEYGHKENLSLEEMMDIVKQGKALGTHFYMFTGGEPLIRKNDIIKLCEQNPDCAFLSYTNGTLVDDAFCAEMRRVGNLALALSIEGTEESNDARRGKGVYQKTLQAMDILKKNRCLFGISVCYTRDNIPYVTSDEFLDLMVEKGVKLAWYFNFMPVGRTADPELIPTPEQRKFMYSWIRKVRSSTEGKPMFAIDFQDDGEFVGGCIAGGRNYFHINSAGDIEPCVFIHYSDSNIREKTLLEALQSPLFMAYRKNQPFNDNHLRPCPMLENPDALRRIVRETGAKSTNLMEPEDVETLCAKCDRFAKEWAPVAEEIWNSTTHPKTFTQYYRDNGKGKRQ